MSFISKEQFKIFKIVKFKKFYIFIQILKTTCQSVSSIYGLGKVYTPPGTPYDISRTSAKDMMAY
jgi:hypothetical protein